MFVILFSPILEWLSYKNSRFNWIDFRSGPDGENSVKTNVNKNTFNWSRAEIQKKFYNYN